MVHPPFGLGMEEGRSVTSAIFVLSAEFLTSGFQLGNLTSYTQKIELP